MKKARKYGLTFKLLVFITFCLFSSNLSSLYGQVIRQNLQKVLPSSKSAASEALITARFSHTPLIIVTGLPVKFLDKSTVNNSTGVPDARVWDFGDGNTSYEQNPLHTYQNPGAYTISLTVTAGSASSKATKKVRVYGSKATSSLKIVEVLPDFTFSPVNPEVGMSVQFKDGSTGNPTSWSWDFGDGGRSTSQNPQHQYQNSGTFNVTLTASNGTSSKSLTKTITVMPVLTPGFSFSPVNPEAGELIQFQDSTSGNPSAWNWNFGDSSTSNLQNPTHTYNNAGTYTVTLQVSNGDYTRTVSKTITVLAPITVGFSYSPANPVVDQDVQFSNASTGSITSYSWNFGDGSSSTLKDPVHKYSAAGNFTVTLTATNATGSKSKSQTITVNQSLSPSFSYSPASPYAGQAVQFTASSSGNPTSWSWDFGDGSTSSLQNPTHAYSSAGTYTVTLTASNNLETKTASKTINVKAVIQADFTYSPANPTAGTQIQFTDKSTGNITSWSWQFGDGGTSSQKNPTKTYSTAGSYNVKLTVSDGTTSNSMTQTVTVVESLAADFTFSPSSPAAGQEVQFMDNSKGSTTSWSWDFGDGGKSTAKNPAHTYSQAGAYTVKLVISDGTNSSTKNKSLTVSSSSSSKVITASSCTLADVQAAIATAKAGDTVVVPNGTASWSSPLIINKGIILKAATQGGVKIINDTSMSSNANSIDPSNYVIAYVPLDETTGQPFRLSGFVIDGGGKRWTFLGKTGSPTLMVNKFRLDHCTFQNGYGNAGLVFYGEIYGVIDNCTIYGGSREFAFNETTWRNFTFEYGSANNRYYEDNIFYFGTGMNGSEGGLGGRYCFRYNTFYNQGTYGVNPWFDMHGNMGTGGNLSTMGAEIYGNVIYCNNKSLKMLDQRGGKLIAFNNKGYNVNGANGQKIEEEYPDSLNPPETNPAGQPQHVSDSYYWNQYYNDSLNYDYYITPTVDYEGNTGIVPRWDVHCFKQVQKFDGSSGVGVGPLAQRPSYCTTEGVAWWATDENKLYRWHNGQWELFYTPYTYPHPLRTTLND